MRAKLTIEEMRAIAKSRGGECLSETYVNANTKLRWKCKEGHIWENTPGHIKAGQWCRICECKKAGIIRRGNIDEARALAESKGGCCLSEKYGTARTLLKWRCSEGHVWRATPDNVKRGTWCPVCGDKRAAKSRIKYRIEDMQNMAVSRGGECLSQKFVNVDTPLEWKCSKGHVWRASPYHIIQRKQWCPMCASQASEKICRKYFEIMFKEKFPKSKPTWLINSRGNKQELDGFCSKLGIAFEYQGSQHYLDGAPFGNHSTLAQRKVDDENKRALCKINGVRLIEIPYTVKHQDIGKYILDECKQLNISAPNNDSKINYREFNIYPNDVLTELQQLAISNGGKCLSTAYVDGRTKLEWQCKEGHVWKATPEGIKSGRWCPICAGRYRTIEEMQEMIAKEKGGKCLSSTYINSQTKLEWECGNGHRWWASPAHVKGGRWCPFCARSKRRKKIWPEK